jgi:DNA polymerase-3 subunit beta
MTTATATRKSSRRGGVTLATTALKQALADVAAAVPTRSPKPVLANVRLGDGTLTATDLEIQIEAAIDYTGEPLLLPFARLRAILAEARCDEVTLAVDGNVCIVTAGRGTWRLPVENANEWPAWEPDGLKPLVRLPADQFVRAVTATVYATDNESSRFALGAVLLDVAGSECSFVATDGRRLSLYQCEHDQDVDPASRNVPAAALASVAAVAKRAGDEAVQLESTERELVATLPGCTVTARLIEGRFPGWRKVIPSDRDGVVQTVVDRGELLAATRAAAIVTSEQSKGVDFTFGGDGVVLHGQSNEYGQSDVTIDAIEGGEPVKVKLDPRYVAEWLKGLTAEDDPNVTIEVVDASSACVMRSGDDCTGVIMPLALD